MRPLLFYMPAWVAGLLPAAVVAQIILQLEFPRKWIRWRTPAAVGAAIALEAAVAILYRETQIPIYAYGVVLALAAVVAITIGVARCPLAGFEKTEIVDFGLWVVLWGVVGARVFHVIENHDTYFTGERALGFLAALKVWKGGLVFYGGMIGAMCYSAYYAFRRENGLNALVRIFDLGAPCVLFGLAFGRLGCFLNGCCYGSPTSLPWGVAFPQGSPLWRAILTSGERSARWVGMLPLIDSMPPAYYDRMERLRAWADDNVPHTFHVHPQQLYASVIAIALGMFLSWVFYKKLRPGTVSVLTLSTYPPARFVLEGWFRGDTPRVFPSLPFTISQYVSMFALAAGVVWAIVLVRARRLEAAKAASRG